MGNRNTKFYKSATKLLGDLALSSNEQHLVEHCIRHIEGLKRRKRRVKRLNFVVGYITLVLGVLITALVSFERITIDSNALFWIIWSFSVVNTIMTRVLQTQGFSKQYSELYANCAKLENELWRFFAGVGVYDVEIDQRLQKFLANFHSAKKRTMQNIPEFAQGPPPEPKNRGDNKTEAEGYVKGNGIDAKSNIVDEMVDNINIGLKEVRDLEENVDLEKGRHRRAKK